ncbi:hypothetical protein VIBNISOn1_690002 [Vibrio nigripulchritudo SOn1]|uniref:Uncharacterized protein n=1 Tax=Vibrio nigripulchritudo SOn1 TaxID=1238450 RepID=A0AAV2VW80_9VIBR|nr:hypothetical protein [Vibrio nigripulchritudo]CCO48884.1 hypothetical protein VIBNISOn1_690002 [Vibrio nigripulchritudo SOn1]
MSEQYFSIQLTSGVLPRFLLYTDIARNGREFVAVSSDIKEVDFYTKQEAQEQLSKINSAWPLAKIIPVTPECSSCLSTKGVTNYSNQHLCESCADLLVYTCPEK